MSYVLQGMVCQVKSSDKSADGVSETFATSAQACLAKLKHVNRVRAYRSKEELECIGFLKATIVISNERVTE